MSYHRFYKMRPLKNASRLQRDSSSSLQPRGPQTRRGRRSASGGLTGGIYRIFRGLKFEPDKDTLVKHQRSIGQKGAFCKGLKTASFTVAFLFLLLFMNEQSGAGTEADQLQKKVTQAIEIRQQTQKKEDTWAGKKAELMARYRSLKANQNYLEKLKLKTERFLSSQKARLAEFERKIKESARIREELQSYLESVAAQLEEFIKKDFPFLLKERATRLASIKETLTRPDKPAAEKYRRVMEALQIEAEYGRSVEVYQDTIDLNGQSVLMDILRLGRLSLFCQTPDGKMVGHYDRAAGRWVSLPSRYRREINNAVDMARRERTIDLVRLPIGRIAP